MQGTSYPVSVEVDPLVRAQAVHRPAEVWLQAKDLVVHQHQHVSFTSTATTLSVVIQTTSNLGYSFFASSLRCLQILKRIGFVWVEELISDYNGDILYNGNNNFPTLKKPPPPSTKREPSSGTIACGMAWRIWPLNLLLFGVFFVVQSSKNDKNPLLSQDFDFLLTTILRK